MQRGTRTRMDCETFGAGKQRKAGNQTVVLRGLGACMHATNHAALVCNWPGPMEPGSVMRDKSRTRRQPNRPLTGLAVLASLRIQKYIFRVDVPIWLSTTSLRHRAFHSCADKTLLLGLQEPATDETAHLSSYCPLHGGVDGRHAYSTTESYL